MNTGKSMLPCYSLDSVVVQVTRLVYLKEAMDSRFRGNDIEFFSF
jgi:hypothetical protein